MRREDFSVLVGCEESGAVREAFLELGYDAYSCDLKQSRKPSNRHIIGDVRDVLKMQRWNLCIIMHPPCTRLTNAGVRWLFDPPGKLNSEHYTDEEIIAYRPMSRQERLDFMWNKLREGAQLFSDCWNTDQADNICVENPIMHKHAKALITNYEEAAQTVQPWHFGDPFFKATSFYLKGKLRALADTNRRTDVPKKGDPRYASWSKVHYASGPKRGEIRSETFPGIANAFAQQFPVHILGAHP